jgi:addiction module RelE/StbE family toxin
MVDPATGKQEKRNEGDWSLAPGFADTWKKYKTAAVSDAMTAFDRCKRAVPPKPLPPNMKDHKLKGRLGAFRECHLGDDVLLIYQPLPDGTINLVTVCEHADLTGPKAKSLLGRIKPK